LKSRHPKGSANIFSDIASQPDVFKQLGVLQGTTPPGVERLHKFLIELVKVPWCLLISLVTAISWLEESNTGMHRMVRVYSRFGDRIGFEARIFIGIGNV
jgi:hypothetical protein